MLLISVISVNFPKVFLQTDLNSNSLYVSLFKDKNSYRYREPVHIYGRIYYAGQPVEGGIVAVQLEHEGRIIALKTISAGVPSDNWPITITSIIPCDSEGTPKEKFMRGEDIYVNVTVRNNDINEMEITISITIFDIDLTPLDFAYLKANINSLSTLSWMPQVEIIPEWCSTGTAQIAVSILTDFPSEDGYPLCPGQTKNFVISSEGSTTASTKTIQSYTDSTYYSVTYRILPYSIPCSKTLDLYVGAYYSGMKAFANTTIPVNYEIVTDVVYDHIIDIYDVSAITILYGKGSTDELWNPIYDIVPNGEIDIYDVSYVTIQYGLSY